MDDGRWTMDDGRWTIARLRTMDDGISRKAILTPSSIVHRPSSLDPDGGSLMKRTLEWQIATVKAIKQETPTVKTFTLALPDWMQHRAGQHYDVRLTAPDGYQAQRSYSIGSA